MRWNRASSMVFLLFFGMGMGGCFHSLQMDRKGLSSLSEGIVGGAPGGANGISEADAVAILDRRAETKGSEPSEARAVSALDGLNERFSYGSGDASEAIATAAVELLKDPSEEVRFRAAELLGKVGSDDHEGALMEASVKDRSLVVREMAAESLEHLGLGTEVWSE